jgi:2-(1,2-epoxy-1,2-dihydrophenyl)acetyl-CoA isomerase
MADDAFLQCPFAAISLLPDGGLSWHLVRQLGYRRAFQLSVECERVDATRCIELGLANRAVPAAQLRDAALDWARSLCERAPLSVAATKKAMRFAANCDWASTYDLEAELQAGLAGTADNREGIAAFFEKRAPEFTGK